MRITYKRKLKQVSGGLFNSFLDASIFSIAVFAQVRSLKPPWEIVAEALHATKMIRPINFKRSIYNAEHKGYLEKKKEYYEITALGRERLKKIMPAYEKKRPWDGKLYLITYDIPEKKRIYRDYLRIYLNKIACGMMQQSVWLTPYNPKAAIADFVKQRKLAGLILVSELKEGSYIGGKDALEVVAQVYHLKDLDNQYRDFCLRVDKKELAGEKLILKYLAILKKDPQIPFELLPTNWWGEDAHDFYQIAVRRMRN